MGRRRTRDAPIDIVLPITPMLDMSFQLLAFFVMTFKSSSASEIPSLLSLTACLKSPTACMLPKSKKFGLAFLTSPAICLRPA